ncbi:hypothetical protein [Streptomyces lanatus]|uniref:Uncharacterized protein n=1 Tax=Streptomyces lanatus TaxID=66900 RepID=A0ABV1Y154_9ACTN|nr:hypothetical protein [Streptomyces lanatus]GHH23602.1 hypothetical protein GCM10018780_73180 [Streptomyces lanatus]
MTMKLEKQGFDGTVAWDTPGTRRALRRWAAWNLAKSLGWVGLWSGALYVTVMRLPVTAVVPMVFVLFVIALAAIRALGRLAQGARIRRILAVYPWRRQHGAVRIDKGRAVFVLPDPDDPERTASLRLAAALLRAWTHEALKDYDEELWYAGDPRFACVVAKPGLRGLDCLTQPTAYDTRTDPRRKGLSPEARRRARAIGARVGD